MCVLPCLRKRVNCEGTTTIYYYSEWVEDLKQRNSTAGYPKTTGEEKEKENYPFGVQVIRKKISKKKERILEPGVERPRSRSPIA